MKRSMKDYVADNQRVYRYYLHVPKWYSWHGALSVITLVIISGVIFLTRQFFLKFCFLREAMTRDLGDQEVTEWVAMQVRSYHLNLWFFIWLVATTVGAISWVLFVYRKMKIYDLYKKQKWLIWPPVITYALLGIVTIVSSRVGPYSVFLAIQVIAEMLPVFSAFKLFLPLDMREGYGETLEILEWLSNYIIKRM